MPDEDVIQLMKTTGLQFTIEGVLEDFLGVRIVKHDDGSYELTQKRLIDSIIQEVFGHLADLPKGKAIPMASSKLLSRHEDSPDFQGPFEMRRIVGKLNFLAGSTRPDIAYATHQIARFVSNPKVEHGKAIEWLTRYLIATRDYGYFVQPDGAKDVEIYVDADFAGNWDPELAGLDPDTAKSRHGFVITYMDVPVLWKSSLQTEFALSTTEAELIGLSMSLKTAIPLMNLFNEMNDLGFLPRAAGKNIHCELFEDNSGALAIAKLPKVRPRTKHINNKYFHFVEHTTKEASFYSFHKIDTVEQPADLFTKPLPIDLFVKHRMKIQGW
jgi:hypothetical protein